MMKRLSGFLPSVLLGMAIGLAGCAYVEDVPQRDAQYIDVPYTGQVPAQVAQTLEQQYPDGFWEDRPVAPGQQIVVAVKDFTGNPDLTGIDPPVVDPGRSFADMISNALVNSGQVRVVERERIAAILTELEFSQTGLAATPPGYDTGQMETVDYVITGSIVLLDPLLRVEAKALHVLSSQIVAAESLMVGQANQQAANALVGMLLATLLRR